MITRNSVGGAYPIKTLGEVVEFLDNKRRPVTESDRQAGAYPYYGANGKQGTIDNYIFDEPLVLLAEDGGHFNDPDRGVAYRISGKTWVNNHAHVLRPKQGLDLVFLCRVLENYDVSPFVTGTTRGKLTKAGASEILIPLPPVPEQIRIAAILDQADELRVKRREALAQLDSLTQAIFIEMFGDPSEETPRFAKYPLQDLVDDGFQNGAYFPKESYVENGIEMVHMSDAFGGIIKRGNLKRVSCSQSDIEKYNLTIDDIIIARRSLTYDGAAKPCMVPKALEPLIFESSFIRVRADKKRVDPLFLFHYLNNNQVREKFVRPYVTQSTISGINQANLAQVPVVLPPIDLQHEFNKKVAAVENVRGVYRKAEAQLNSLILSLQYRAFRGEL